VSKHHRQRVDSGRYYARDDVTRRLHEVGDVDRVPDMVICRRVADYPAGVPPVAAQLTACTRCGAPIAFNPAGPHQDMPKVCMQCAGIEPLPIERPS
jgi:hypothetical protein